MPRSLNRRLRACILPLVAATGVVAALPVHAEGLEFSGSGFLTVAAGKIVGGDAEADFNGWKSPAYIADYGQAGVYERGGWSLGPDSKLGLQGMAVVNDRLSATVQVVSRGAHNGKVDLEWFYGTWKFNEKLSVQIGRKRLPLFYYSESQDVGLAMPWVRPPPQSYGWDIVNFNGANLIYRGQLGDWTSATEIFYGNETRKNNPYQQIYNGKGTHTSEKWKDISGGSLSLSKGWFESRFSYAGSAWDFWGDALQPDGSLAQGRFPRTRQRFYSAAFVATPDDWTLIAEFSKVDRRQSYEDDWSRLFAVGYRFGKWQPMLTYARYHGSYLENTTSWALQPNQVERHVNRSLTLRYELSPSSAVKLQYDRWQDHNGPSFITNPPYTSVGHGNPRLLSISYDRVF